MLVLPYRPVAPVLIFSALLLSTSGGAPLLPGSQGSSCDPPSGNPIVCENQLPGDPESTWGVSGAGDPDIQGFTTDISIDQGQTVQFKIKSTTAYQLDIYRMGYYGGAGARRVATIPSSSTTSPPQPACLSDTVTGLVDCGNWSVTAAWTVPQTAVSGIYFAKAMRTGGGASHIVFVVRDDDGKSDVLFQTSDTTWQAYNRYGGNSLYVGSPAGRAYKVSYNRPFTTRATSPEDWVFHSEYPMVRWLEANGYNVSYSTGVDSDRRGPEILEHRVFMSVGHDEYWSAAQRARVEEARAAGVHLTFFSGNEVYWKTRWENALSADGTSYRTLVCYKETHAGQKIDPLPNVWTGTWRDPRFSPPADGGRPENALTGTWFRVNSGTSGIRVPAAEGKLRFWRNTSVANLAPGGAAQLPDGTLGYEWDEDADNGSRPPGLIRLSDTTVNGVQILLDYGSTYGTASANHALTLYRHNSGALVFGAGTIQWSWGLDANHDGGSPPTSVAMQQATMNLLADMNVQPLTPAAGLVPTDASTDSVAPISTIESPAQGATVAAQSSVTVSGTASDSGGGLVGGVEVSTDGGVSWRRATGRSNWTFTWQAGAPRTVTLLSRAVDDSGNLEAAGSGRTVEVVQQPATCPCSLWNTGQTPTLTAANDPNPVELGTRFRSDVFGYVSAIRFYKSAQNTGPHTGHLWSASGTLLGTVAFPNNISAGWHQAAFATPVPIAANTHYIVSYHTQSGNYSADDGYFAASGVDNGPLHAPIDGQSGANGVYKYGTPGFPSSTSQSANYWVDVVFVTSTATDTTPPQITATSPPSGASGVSPQTRVTVTFNEAMDPATVTMATFVLRNAAGVGISATVAYDAGSQTATLQPGSTLANSTTYTATVRGGSSGVKDTAGNALASDYVSSFTTEAPPPPPPNEGPGGPVLVVSWSANPFGRYYAEILRNEGMNAFLVADITSVTPSVLAAYDVVILGEMPVDATQATMFTDWVTAGGNLVAMRPDKRLASLLGLSDAGTTLSEGYLLVNTSAAPGLGVVGETMQFHGVADRYAPAGASVVATLYSSATAPTSNPAVTLRSVGTNGGQAAAFTYDLARSIVLTRQGNPAWSGMERDGIPPVRSDDLFYGGSVPDWVDRSKVAIPQADEQQRLLMNLMTFMSRDRLPLPRFWYLPRGLKAAVVMTGDDHGNNGTAGRFDLYAAASPSGCSVSNWECIRASSYIYPSTPIGATQAAAYDAAGFELAPHISTGCANYTAQSVNSDYARDLSDFAAIFPAVRTPRTNRTHCIAWSDYVSQAEVAATHGIRLDTNYYYWPGSWVADTPGLFTGSGMPMRFARPDGTLIDVYQATTQLTDESAQTYPKHIDTLLDRALGPEGYYSVITANMHTDTVNHAGSDAIVASARARGVPIVAARQMLEWLDGRNGSSFGGLAWSADRLTFTVAVGTGANGLQALLPVDSPAGQLVSITRAGGAVSYTTELIKGVTYARFAAAAGSYEARYGGADTIPPVISGVAASATSTAATITWSTNEPATSRVDYGLSASSLSASAVDSTMRTSHQIPLTGLTPGTQYFYRVASSDSSGNTSAAPATAASFTTEAAPPPPGGTTLVDTTAADFGAGTRQGTYVAVTADGEVLLAPAAGAEFLDATLPADWTSAAWNTGGSAVPSGGTLVVNGARAHTTALFAPGAVPEFSANFGGDGFQHAGLGLTLNETPWAIFSTASGGGLWARTHNGSTATDTPLPGSWLGTFHRYRIEWNTSSVRFLIDGAVVATHPVTIATSMRPIVSDFTVGAGAVALDWARLSPYATAGTFTSRVLDAGTIRTWLSATWAQNTPAGTSLVMAARFGDTPTPDASWTGFSTLSGSGASLSATSRYVQYRASLSSTVAAETPVLNDVRFSAGAEGTQPSISIADVSVPEGNAGTLNRLVTLTLSASSAQTVTVNYATSNGTATAGSDYTAVTGTVTFNSGATTATISVPILGDTTVEPDETFFIDLTAPINATIADARGIVTVVNDDASSVPQITIGDVTVAEGNTNTQATFIVTLSAASSSTITVAYATADGTAVAAGDYVAASGTLTFAPGVTTQSIPVTVLGDTLDEADEAFVVSLSAPVNATLGAPAQGTATITDDDPLPSLTVNDVTVMESSGTTVQATFTVTLSAASGRTVGVNYATSNGTATAGGDYTATSGTLSFAPGVTSLQVSVAVAGDLAAEATETFNLDLSAAVNATIADTRGVATVIDDDVQPSFSIDDVSVTERNSGTQNVTFTVRLSAPSGSTVTVTYSTADGSAVAGSDYVAKTGSLTFTPGVTTRTFNVAVRGDRVREVTEAFVVNLTGATNATLADAQATCTIFDND